MQSEQLNLIISSLDNMKSDKISNYVLSGLNSYKVGKGMIRLFECTRNHQDSITPHSHRYNFTCLVLSGTVTNRIWKESDLPSADEYMKSMLIYKGEVGEHEQHEAKVSSYVYEDSTYNAGDVYRMTSNQIHSIRFSKNCRVLFFEEPDIRDNSIILEPYVGGEVIKTYVKEDHMFKGE